VKICRVGACLADDRDRVANSELEITAAHEFQGLQAILIKQWTG
jgi:hypothetical protein